MLHRNVYHGPHYDVSVRLETSQGIAPDISDLQVVMVALQAH